MRKQLGRSALILVLAAGLAACHQPRAQVVVPNDNRMPAGTVVGGLLTLRLEVRPGLWHPEGPDGVAIGVPTFAVEGRAPEVPGPLIRVPAGTRVALHVRNTLASETVALHGFHDRPGHANQAVTLAPAAATDVSFGAGPAGTYFYWATTTGAATTEARKGYEGMLTGAFVVDPVAAAAASVDDRIFILGFWTDGGDPHPEPALKDKFTLVINGRSWPATERLTYPVNRPIHWRVINASNEGHPMHLHGTYFSLDAQGDESTSHELTGDKRPVAVTDLLASGTTIGMTWTPGQPGNWLFHCHILFHIDPAMRMTPDPAPTKATHDHSAGDPERHMAGLVLAISVLPEIDTVETAAPTDPRRLTLDVGERPGIRYPSPDKSGESWPGLGYRWTDPARASATQPFVSPGATLVLTRGEPVAISVVNHLSKATTVHWHGIELESYYDGVSGIGGSAGHVTPGIAPGATFVARFTPPRTGTFMYHTHLNDYEQLSTGLYGAIVVVDPGARFDPDLDRVFVLSRGPDDDNDPVLINGTEWPGGQEMRVGATYRLRFAGITVAAGVTVSIRSGAGLLQWRPLAKDGSTLRSAPASASASQTIHPGETYDFAFTPPTPGALRLVAAIGPIHTELPLRVR